MTLTRSKRIAKELTLLFQITKVYDPKKMLGQLNMVQKLSGQKILAKRNFGPKNFGRKKFWSKIVWSKNFRLKKMFGPKLFGPQNRYC